MEININLSNNQNISSSSTTNINNLSHNSKSNDKPINLSNLNITQNQNESLETILSYLGFKYTEENLTLANNLLLNSLPLTKENIQVLNQASKLFENNSIEKGIFFLINNLKPTEGLANQLNNYISKETKISSQLMDILSTLPNDENLTKALDILTNSSDTSNIFLNLNNEIVNTKLNIVNKLNNLLNSNNASNNDNNSDAFKNISSFLNKLIDSSCIFDKDSISFLNTFNKFINLQTSSQPENTFNFDLNLNEENEIFTNNLISNNDFKNSSDNILDLINEFNTNSENSINLNNNIYKEILLKLDGKPNNLENILKNFNLKKSDIENILKDFNSDNINLNNKELENIFEKIKQSIVKNTPILKNDSVKINENILKSNFKTILNNNFEKLINNNKEEFSNFVKSSSFKELLSYLKDFPEIKEELSTILNKIEKFNTNLNKNLSFDFEKSSVEDLNKFFNTIQKKIKTLKKELYTTDIEPKNKDILNSLENVTKNIDFMCYLKNNIYLQVPLNINNEHQTGELFVFKDKKNSKKNSDNNGSALLCLDLANLGHIESFINKNGQNISIEFRIKDKNIENLFREKIEDLSSLLKEKNLSLVNVQFKNLNESFSLISEIKKTSNPINISSFNKQV